MTYYKVPVYVFLQADSPGEAMQAAMELCSLSSGDDPENPRWAQSEADEVTEATDDEVAIGRFINDPEGPVAQGIAALDRGEEVTIPGHGDEMVFSPQAAEAYRTLQGGALEVTHGGRDISFGKMPAMRPPAEVIAEALQVAYERVTGDDVRWKRERRLHLQSLRSHLAIGGELRPTVAELNEALGYPVDRELCQALDAWDTAS